MKPGNEVSPELGRLRRAAAPFTIGTRHLAMALLLSGAMFNAAPAQGADVLTSRNDNERTGANLSETLLNIDNVRPGTFGKRYSYPTYCIESFCRQGHIYAQPLYLSNVRAPSGALLNILLVASTSNFFFAFDADADVAPAGSRNYLWARDLFRPPTMDEVRIIGGCNNWFCNPMMGIVHRNDVYGDGSVGYTPGNISGNVGIMSTPVIDRARGIVFVVARVVLPGSNIGYRIHALDLLTGADRGNPMTISARASGITFEPKFQNQRPGLALSRGQVIVAFGSHADVMPYHGWVMSFRHDDNAGFSMNAAFVTTPGGDTSLTCASIRHLEESHPDFKKLANNCPHGGIWMSGRAPAVDANGNVLLMVGNGKNDLVVVPPEVTRNFGNSLIKLDPMTLEVLDFFTPSNHTDLNARDLDFGGSGPMIVPQSDLIVGGGKEGFMHVWPANNLGGFTPNNIDAGTIQRFSAGGEQDYHDRSVDRPGGVSKDADIHHHGGHIMGGPVFWQRPPGAGGSRLYNWSENARLHGYAFNPAASQPVGLPPANLGSFVQLGHPGGILSLSANGAASRSGIVWAATYVAGKASKEGGYTGALIEVRPGILRAYSAESLEELWTSESDADGLGDFAKFTPPTVANGRVYMATFSNQVVVYGLSNHRYTHPNFLADGSLLQGTGPAIFVAYGGAKFHVPNMATLNARFPGVAVQQISDEVLAGIPDAPRDGTLLGAGTQGIFVIYGGAKFHVPSMPIFNALFAGASVKDMWDGALAAIPDIPRDGTLLTEASGAIWVVYGGAKFHVPNMPVFDALFAGARVNSLWDGALGGIPDIPRDGTLLTEISGAIWVIYGGAKFHVPNMPVLDALFAGVRVNSLWNGALGGIPDIPRDGTLLTETSGAIWVIYGGAKFHVPNMPVFDALFAGARVNSLWDGALGGIPDIPRDGTLLTETSGAIWVIYGGAKFHVPDMPTFDLFFAGNRVHPLWDGALAGIPDIPRDGTLFMERTTRRIYMIAGGRKVPAPQAPRILAIVVWDGMLAQIP